MLREIKKSEKNPSSRVLFTCIQSIRGIQQRFLICQLLLQSDNGEMMPLLLVAISRSGSCYPLGVAAAVVGQGGCRLTAFEPLKPRIFVVILYWTVSQHLPLNPIRTLLYIKKYVLPSELDLVHFPNRISYSAESSTTVVLHRFSWNRARLKNLIASRV